MDEGFLGQVDLGGGEVGRYMVMLGSTLSTLLCLIVLNEYLVMLGSAQ